MSSLSQWSGAQYEWYALARNRSLQFALPSVASAAGRESGFYFLEVLKDGFVSYYNVSTSDASASGAAGAAGGVVWENPFGIGGPLEYPDLSRVRADVLDVNYGARLAAACLVQLRGP